MEGKLEYIIQSPTWPSDGQFQPRPLVFRVFTKASRPLAWKNSDIKVQQTLPLLSNDEIADGALKDPTGGGLVSIVDGQKEQNPIRLVRVTMQVANSM